MGFSLIDHSSVSVTPLCSLSFSFLWLLLACVDLASIRGDKILNILTILCWVSDLEKEEKRMRIVIGAGKMQCYFITGCNIVQVLRM